MKRSDLIWGYLSQFLQYGAALIVLPVLLYFLSTEELGIWYVFMTISSFVTMVDLSITPVLARNCSYLLAGSDKVPSDGYEYAQNTTINKSELIITYHSSKLIFSFFSFVLVVLFYSLGSLYIDSLITANLEPQKVILAWYIFALATAVDLYFKYINGFLQGCQKMAGYYKVITTTRVTFVLLTSALVYFDFGLLGISVAYLGSVILGRYVAWSFFRTTPIQFFLNEVDGKQRVKFEHLKDNFKVLLNGSSKIFVASVGGFLILKSPTLISSSYLGLDITASYALTMQVISVMTTFSTVYLNTKLPYLARLRIQGKYDEIRSVLGKALGVSITLFMLGSVVLNLVGNEILILIESKTILLRSDLLMLLCVIMLLEMNHANAATVIISGNQVPFVKASLFSGICVVVGSFIVTAYFDAGIWAIIAVQGIVQLAYNNWKWPAYMAASLNIKFHKLLFIPIQTFIK